MLLILTPTHLIFMAMLRHGYGDGYGDDDDDDGTNALLIIFLKLEDNF